MPLQSHLVASVEGTVVEASKKDSPVKTDGDLKEAHATEEPMNGTKVVMSTASGDGIEHLHVNGTTHPSPESGDDVKQQEQKVDDVSLLPEFFAASQLGLTSVSMAGTDFSVLEPNSISSLEAKASFKKNSFPFFSSF